MGVCSHRVLNTVHIFLSALDEVPDPRASNVRHDFGELLVIAFASVLCGSTSCAEMAAFGRAKKSFFKNFLKLKHAIPSHDTFSLAAVRNHWAIENALHWQLYVSFREDAARNRKDNGPGNIAVLRRRARDVLRRDTSKSSLSIKIKRAGWATTFLRSILSDLATI